jgi:hypothetical protein
MSVYIVTGKLGAGKTLSTIYKVQQYLQQGRPVASNVELYLDHLLPARKRDVTCYRIPAKPTVADLRAIGNGNATYDEDKNGLLVLDECGTWFNSRGWNDPTRREVIDWMLHARKLGWDVMLIVQDKELLDKQARDALAEHVVYCKRLDRFRIPIVTSLVKIFTGADLRLPRLHVAIVKYGDSEQHPTVDRWFYRGSALYKGYDTKQVFAEKGEGTSCVLSPWHTKGRYLPPRLTLRELIFALLFTVPVLLCALVLWIKGTRGATPGAYGSQPERAEASSLATASTKHCTLSDVVSAVAGLYRFRSPVNQPVPAKPRALCLPRSPIQAPLSQTAPAIDPSRQIVLNRLRGPF